MTATKAPAVPRVMIWHAERNEDGRLSFMYWPVLATLVAGFRATRVQLAFGAGESSEYTRNLKKLERGDALVWIGKAGLTTVPWRRLGRIGVRRIYYQTEPTPRHDCSHLEGWLPYFGSGLSPRDVWDEIWDFSRHNLESCNETRAPSWKMRYVPPGFAPLVHASTMQGLESMRRPSIRPKLTFFGSLQPWAGRRRCYRQLETQLGEQLEQVCDL